MSESSLFFVVLAAGMGTRMKSQRPKVMHEIGFKPMLGHVIDLGRSFDADGCAVVIGPDMEPVSKVAVAHYKGAQIFEQTERLGTAHAVLSAKSALEGLSGYVFVLYGDTPLLTKAALEGLYQKLQEGADVGVLGFEANEPTGYGRLLVDEAGELVAIREQKDATADELKVTFCNSGVMGFRAEIMTDLLLHVGNENANGEYYLTDVVELARKAGLKTVATLCAEQDVLGVNDRVQLSEAENIFQNRMREQAQRNGATLIAPETVFFSSDTLIGEDVVVEPHVVFGPKVVIGRDVHVKSFCHFEGTDIAAGAVVGPYARLRPGALIGEGAKVGNFVEIKNADVQTGAKVNHLTYIGDALIGPSANIGAGTITCNYDGFFKHKTVIGENAFIGSNSSLVAPVTIGAGAFVGSGSVISEDVKANDLAITRAERKIYENWAARFRKSQLRRKEALARSLD